MIKVLKEKNEKDQAQYEQTMRVMKRNKRGDEKICDFLGAKLNERLELKEEEEKKRINGMSTNHLTLKLICMLYEDRVLRSPADKPGWRQHALISSFYHVQEAPST